MALRLLPSESKTFTLYDLQNPGGGPVTSGAVVVFSLLDAAGTTVAGPTTATQTGDDYAATLTMPATAGRYTLQAAITYAGSTTYQTEDVVVSPLLGSRGETRRDLRRRVAMEFGGLLVLTATAASGVAPYTTFRDDERLIGPNDHYRTRTAYVSRGAAANMGTSRFITGSTFSARTITVDPAFPAAFAIGDEVELWNERGGKGLSVGNVHAAIDFAIRDAAAMGGVPMFATVTAAFDAESPTLTMPGVFETVHEVQYRLASTQPEWTAIPGARNASAGGWHAHGADGLLDIFGGWRTNAAGASIRVFGTGRPDGLNGEDDSTEVNPEFVVKAAIAKLLWGMLSYDPLYERMIGRFEAAANALRSQAVPTLPAGSTWLR